MAMLPKTMDDLLSAIEQYHKGLAEHLSNCADDGAPEREQLLLNYLAEHEKKLADTLSFFREREKLGPLNTWFYAYTDRHPITLRDPRETDFKNLDCEQICAEISNIHEQLLDLYVHLHERAECDSSRRTLDQLLNIERSNAKLLAREAVRAQEM
ncbi:hypothetical protein [Gilvimarinus agarilyticus]|uniref:hypothetical protein n=1 Tax=Gilvimarinus agarilyticus TaxID=679259 RepID=UPI0005A1BC5C|nr:hypothetical protein [Gilvimarinus agarilyticus]